MPVPSPLGIVTWPLPCQAVHTHTHPSPHFHTYPPPSWPWPSRQRFSPSPYFYATQDAQQHARLLQASALYPSSATPPPAPPLLLPNARVEGVRSPDPAAAYGAHAAQRVEGGHEHESVALRSLALPPGDGAAAEQLRWLEQAVEYYDAVQAVMDATSLSGAGGGPRPPLPPQADHGKGGGSAAAAAAAAATNQAWAGMALPGLGDSSGECEGGAGDGKRAGGGLLPAGGGRGAADAVGWGDMVSPRDQDRYGV